MFTNLTYYFIIVQSAAEQNLFIQILFDSKVFKLFVSLKMDSYEVVTDLEGRYLYSEDGKVLVKLKTEGRDRRFYCVMIALLIIFFSFCRQAGVCGLPKHPTRVYNITAY